MQEQAKYSKIQRLFSSVNKRSGANVGFVLLDENAKINGRINQKEDLIYISKDNLTNGNWAGTVVHELTHFAEGTEEYNKLVNMLLSDENTFNSAIDSISKKGYNFSLDGLSGLDSNQAVRYNRKYNILWNKLSSNEQAELYSRIDALHHQNHKESKLPNGNCFIETENKIVETDADFDSPSVESVVEFSKFSGKISQAKGLFYEYVNNGRTIRECVAIINEICQEEVAIFYGSDHSENYRQLPRQGRDNSNTRQNIRNGRHGGRNTSTNRKAIRYHFNDDGSTEVTYSDGSTEIKHSLKDGTDDIAYGEFLSELNAHMSEIMFGNEAFVDRVICTDAPLAEKILGKISDLKEAFGRIGDPEAQAQHKRLVDAEKLYLDAIEAVGKKYENGKIISVYDDEDEGKENIVQTKYSFAGEKAQTADNMSLENAQRMLAGGIDSEIIRKETGWFKGYDGKWRFEIDDSDAYLVENPKFENRNDAEGGYFKVAKLGEVFTHDALYKAYPELKDYTVVIQDTEAGTEGMTFLERKQIVLSKTLFERITKEYNDHIWGGKQKEIAKIEATPEYLEMDRYYDDDVIEDMDGEQWLKETELARNKFFSSDLGKRYYQLKWGDVDIRKFEPGWSDKAKTVLYSRDTACNSAH